MSASSRPSLSWQLPLLPILAGVALVELLVNRLLVRLLHLEPLSLSSLELRFLDGSSLFIFELVSVLSVLLLLTALIRLSAYGQNYRPGARLAFPLIGGVAVALAVLGILVRLPSQLLFHLHLSFLFLALLVVLTVVSSPTEGLQKLGAALVFFAFALKLAPAMAHRYSPELAQGGSLFQTGFLVAVTAAGLSLTPRGGWRWSSLVAGVVVCATAVFMRYQWQDTARVIAYGFDLTPPETLLERALVLLALGFTVHTLLRLFTSPPGVDRLRGWGLTLIVLGGPQLSLPYQVALAGLGLLCLAEAATRPNAWALSREAFDQLVRQAAADAGAPRVSVTGSLGAEVVRLLTPPRGGWPLQVTLCRRAGAIDDVEIIVGEIPPREPPLTIERRGEGRLGPRGEGELVELGDPAFDSVFALRDRRDVGARLLDDATRARLGPLMRGWLGVWPDAAARYHARRLDDPASIAALLTLMVDLSRRSA